MEMFGFNASLLVMVMFMFYSPSTGAVVLGAFAGIMTGLRQQGLAVILAPLGLPFMMLLFCLIALPFIIIQGTTSIVIAIPLASMTVPEDHYHHINMLTDGLAFLKEALVPERVPALSRMHSCKVMKAFRMLSGALQEEDAEEAALVKLYQDTQEIATMSFCMLNKDKTIHVCLSDITNAFQVAGLNDPLGLHFASLILDLVDLNKSHTIKVSKIVAFAIVAGKAAGILCSKLSKFFDFVSGVSWPAYPARRRQEPYGQADWNS
jgi:hypothetical protein